MFVVVNSRQQVICLNDAAASLLSIQPALPASLEVLPPAVAEFVRASFANPEEASTCQITVHSQSNGGTVLTLETSPVSLEADAPGRVIAVRGILPDNSFQSKIRHFERLARLGVLSAGLAHELRNALVALSTMADLMIEQHENHELAGTVRRELDRANDLAVRMLKYARPNPQSRKPVSAHEILDRALNLAHPRFRETGAAVRTTLQANPDLISADEAHIEQMLLNLLINAADSMDQSGEVNLTTDTVDEASVGRAVRIEVKDTGTGIPPEVLPNLFQPFFTTKRHGTGLGLYLAQQIINEHSGFIDVNSTPGQGTCVRVYLPVHSN